MFTRENWELSAQIATTLVGLLAVFGVPVTVYKFFEGRRKDLEQRDRELEQRREDRVQREREYEWRRAEFLFELAECFHRDATIVECVCKLEFDDPERTDLKRILRVEEGETPFTPDEVALRVKFNRFLSFLDNVYYLRRKNVLKDDEVRAFEFNLYLLDRHKCCLKYCHRMGFEDVLELYESVKQDHLRQARADQDHRPSPEVSPRVAETL